MNRQCILGVFAVFCLLGSPTFGQSLSLGSVQGEFGGSVELPLSLSTTTLTEPVQAVQAIFDWDGAKGTGLELNVEPAIATAADFVSLHVGADWMALGFTVVTAPLLGDDIPLASAVIECGPGPEAADTPVTFADGVHSVPGSSLLLSNTVTVDSSSIRRGNGLELIDGSFRCVGAEICDDTVDNDGDGLADGDDPDCPREIEVTPLDLVYGDVYVGTEKSLGLTIRNKGAQDLMLNAVEFEVPPNPDFMIAQTPITPTVIAPGEEVIVVVTYTPQEAESDSGILLILNDDADEAELQVSLSGSGVPTSGAGRAAHLPLDCSAEDIISGEFGVVVGPVACTANRFSEANTAMAFNGNGWIDGDVFPVVGGDFILEAWVLLGSDSGSSPGTAFVLHHPDDSAQIPALSLDWNRETHVLLLKHGDREIAVEGLAADWHHVLVAREAGSLSLYVDGQLKSVETDLDLLGGAYTLGAGVDGSRLFHGDLDELVLDVATLDGDAEAIRRVLRGGSSVYVHPSDRVRDVTANPGSTVEALDLRLTTASSESGDLELSGLTLLAEDITEAGGLRPGLGYLLNGRLVMQMECGVEESEITVGELVVHELNPGSAGITLTSAEPILVPAGRTTCFVALFDLDVDAPLNRVIQFRLQGLEDIEIVGAGAQSPFLAGERLVDQAALEGDRLKILSAPPPELEVVFPGDAGTVNATGTVANARMHAMVLGAGDTEGLRLLDIAYRAVEGTSLAGLTNARLVVDLNGNGALDAGEDAHAGAVDLEANLVAFSSLGIEIPASSDIDLVLLADLELSDAALSAGALSIPLVLAAVLFALLVRRYRYPPRLAGAVAVVLVSCVVGVAAGCGGGGGGGGGSSAPATTQQSFQLTLESAADIHAEGLTSGTEPNLIAFPADGIPGPLYVLKS